MNKVFKQHPNLKEYHETSDGTKFFNPHDAKNHAKSLKDNTVKTVKRGAASEPEADQKTSKSAKAEKPAAKSTGKKSDKVDSKDLTPMAAAKLRVEAIEKLKTVKEVEAALEGETANSVKKAGQDRIAAIKAADALTSKEENTNVQTK